MDQFERGPFGVPFFVLIRSGEWGLKGVALKRSFLYKPRIMDLLETKPRPKSKCPRCRSKRMFDRLDGAQFCARCGQRVACDGRLIPSFDRRGVDDDATGQINLL